MHKIWTSVEKEDISALLETVVNMTMTTLQKFQICLHLLKNNPSDDILKEILANSVESTNLRNKFENLAAAVEMTHQAKSWFYENAFELNSLDDFENCDFITIKQLKAVRKDLQDELPVFVRVKQGLRDYQKIHEHNNLEVQISGEEIIESKEMVENITSISRKNSDDKVLLKKPEPGESLDSKTAASELVSEKPLLEEKLQGEMPSDEQIEQAEEMETEKMFLLEQGVEISTWSGPESEVTEVVAETFPLITCADQTQGDRVVEQFLVRTEHIRRLCNLKDGFENFYYDISSGLNINFTELNNYEVDLIGVLGNFNNAGKFFDKLLREDSFKNFQEILTKEGSGMYFVVPQTIYSSAKSTGYLYFYSKDDQDYKKANPKSRSIHFIRYITQLTKNVILLLDEMDATLLAQKSSNSGKKKRRPQKFTVCQRELQKEDARLDGIGVLKTPLAPLHSKQELHSSNAGLYLINSSLQGPKTQKVSTEKSITIKDFAKFFKLHEFDEKAPICEEFREKYLENYHVDVFEEIKKVAASTKATFLDSAEDSGLYKIIDFGVVQTIYKNVSQLDFMLVRTFFDIDSSNSPEREAWKTGMKFGINLTSALAYSKEKTIKSKLEEQLKYKTALKKSVILHLLREKKIYPTHTKDFEVLYNEACKNGIFGDYRFIPPSLTSFAVEDKFQKGLEKLLQDSSEKEKVRLLINSRFKLLEKVASEEITQDREIQNSKYTAYKKELVTKYVQPQVEEVKLIEVTKKFSKLVQSEKYRVESSPENEKQTIDSIVTSTKINESRFNVKYTKTQIEDSKMILDLKKVTFSNFERERIQKQPEMSLTTEMLTISNLCKIELPQLESLRVFPINAGLALLTANCGKQSRVVVYGTSKGQQQFKHEFGKMIFERDFDAINRILCLYSDHDDVKELNFYQFDAEYKNCDNYSRIDLSSRFNFQGVASMKLQYGTKYVWVLESTGNRILKLNIKNGTVANSSKMNTLVSEVKNFTDLHMASNGQCVFLSTDDNESRSVMTETFNVLEEPLPSFMGMTIFQLPETNICLVAVLNEYEMTIQKLIIQGAQQEMKLQESNFNSESEDGNTMLQTSEGIKHWIHNLFWVFIKFPCEDVFKLQQVRMSITALACGNIDLSTLSHRLKESHDEIKNNLRVTFKPTRTICERIHVTDLRKFVNDRHENFTAYFITLSQFIQQLIGFTPMQIARCQANEFLILKDGVALSTESAQDVFEMKDNIDLGLFEAIFNWWSGSVKVISSMGKQTTGKSYMLNHVMGSSFNISGARCTDGCWMTLNVQEDCLYVVLDFEGLGSFERTDQDDMLLSLFNSALSTMTLFKTEHRIDRDTDQLFSKFNLGSDQLKGTGGIFNGSFVIVIKDVADADLQDIGKEFIEKINNILLKEKQNNFITKLYKGGFHINPFPPFQTENFFEEMANLRDDIIAAKPLFTGGPLFRDTMKLLLAKLAINDFTPLGKQQIEARIKFIRNHLETALIHGVLVLGTDEGDDGSSALTLLDQQNERISDTWKWSVEDLNLGEIEMVDTNSHFTEDGFVGLVYQFSQHVTQTSANFSLWRHSLEKFVSLCLENRISRVELWVDRNVAAWQNQDNQEFDDIICSLWDKFKLEKTLLQQKIQFCDEKCSKCFLVCAQIAGHASACSCTTSHQCTENCFYCDEEMASPCKHPFGHENEHVCSEISHICGKKCSFNALNECPNECVLFSNHEGDHACSLKKHLCKKACSVDICSGECQLDCSVPHETHKCAKEQCVHECCVENCKNKCTARNHFHGNSLLIEQFNLENKIEVEEAPFLYNDEELHIQDHFCGAEHSCGKECEEVGYCEVTVEKTVAKEEVFEGKRSTFSYKRQFVQIGKKLRCLRKVLPFTKEHDPPQHYCSTLMTKDHLCTEICPTCENICDKPHGHWETEGDEKHHTSHGNMTKCYFICNREDFDVGEHKYKVGEQSVAEFCHLFCNSLGRGHIHVVECPGKCEDEFSAEHDHRRHETCKYGPNEDDPKDEVQHGAFWELIGFQDPCTGENAETFGKCPFFCSAISHEEEKTSEGEMKRYHCQLDLWHKPVMKLSDTCFTNGTVSKDGHVFPCHHEALAFHWVFALDRSGSMCGNPWAELQKSVTSFMNSRKSLAPEDKYSILLHDHKVYVIEEYKTVKDFDGKELAKWRAAGENDFALAISESDKVINRHLNKSISPVFIFMSDGIWHDGEKEMAELAQKYKTDYKLKVYTIGFGHVNFAKLKELARVGGGDFIECPDGIKLENSFVEIASSMPPTVSVTSSK